MQKKIYKKGAILIYSGGMDSTVLLHQLKNDIKLAVSFDYGSKHNQREIECAKYNCKKLGIEHKIIELPFINKYFKSSLLISGNKIPKDNSNMKSTVVPFRNGIMLSIAVGLAESKNLDAVLIANHSGDHAVYPDCTPSFINSFVKAAKFGTYNKIKIVSAYCHLSKRKIAKSGYKFLGVDFSKTYSCYKGNIEHCGVCATCIERKKALKGFDNTTYKK